ncbi:ABC transporter permease [Phyllobacterium bourgognense]|uniref:Monosaccharide ABC transporter membrane protein (CUT2 family) n=1 Tax=Phyllobacterium bourgognense TaxID=314236 RepID=A0A368YNW9_9HYPH|nr:ABC transporter permease [Phyllobacterium bourgognense]RCW81885.1 monosaccharide ABC transporter membrane protein (CUT2 family) [Phyllobacterium bourgognense]
MSESKLPVSTIPALRFAFDRSLVIAFACIILMLLGGALYSREFLSPEYLLQQLQISAFLGIIASGAMMVILIGHIDLSIPWTVTLGAMMATAVAGWFGETGNLIAIPVGILCGAMVGLLNGLGVAYLRLPSMIFTLGMNAVVQGLMVLHTGGFAPQDHATDAMHFLAVGRPIFGIPNALLIWVVVGAFTIFLLTRTAFGRRVYAVGNREAAAYLSGVNTNAVIIWCFVLSGAAAAFAGVLLAGYSTKAYQAMGDPYLLPAIAAVVLGGTNILGGRGNYLGTIAGVILITLLQSILAVMQMPEAGRQIIYGVVILVMLLAYGRGEIDRK